MEQRADQLCQVFGISAIREKYPAEISGGEKQRTAVARASSITLCSFWQTNPREI